MQASQAKFSLALLLATMQMWPAQVLATTCGTTSSSSTIAVTAANGYRYITSNNCPGYDWTGQTTPTAAAQKTISVRLPLVPTMAATPTTVALGGIGIASNGVLIYGPSDAQGRDAYIYEGSSFNSCRGHTDGMGYYHYHTSPTCTYKDTTGQHSPMVGLMFDGVPLYGPLGDNGVAPSDLDSCNGHVDSTHGFYHYHTTTAYPYTVACLRGCIDGSGLSGIQGSLASATLSSCTAASVQYNYTSIATLPSPWPSVLATTTNSATSATASATASTTTSTTATATKTVTATTTITTTTTTTKSSTTVTTTASTSTKATATSSSTTLAPKTTSGTSTSPSPSPSPSPSTSTGSASSPSPSTSPAAPPQGPAQGPPPRHGRRSVAERHEAVVTEQGWVAGSEGPGRPGESAPPGGAARRSPRWRQSRGRAGRLAKQVGGKRN